MIMAGSKICLSSHTEMILSTECSTEASLDLQENIEWRKLWRLTFKTTQILVLKERQLILIEPILVLKIDLHV